MLMYTDTQIYSELWCSWFSWLCIVIENNANDWSSCILVNDMMWKNEDVLMLMLEILYILDSII